jgi:NADPH:quinone reductase-like Zn-dependent oxidoreductase
MTTPRTMSVLVAESSDPGSLHVAQRPTPSPAPGELLVAVQAAAITSGELDWPESWPAIPGHDTAGIVAASDDDMDDFAPGDAVIALVGFDRDGAASSYVAVPREWLATAPTSIDLVDAASLPLGGLTAWQALVDHAALQSGQHVLVHGGAGGVGGYAVQLAAHLGAHVTATCSPRDADTVRSYGAATVLDYHDALSDAALAGAFHVVLDTVGGEVIARSWPLLRAGGVLVSVAEEPETPEGVDATSRYFVVEPNGEQLAHLARLVDQGALHPVIGRIIPFAESTTAFQPPREHRSGKTVIRMDA